MPIFITSQLVEHIALTATLALLIWCITRFVKRPELAHLLWAAVLIKLLIPFGIGVPVPQWAIAAQTASPPALSTTDSAHAVERSFDDAEVASTSAEASNGQGLRTDARYGNEPSLLDLRPSGVAPRAASLQSVAIGIWLAGAGFITVRLTLRAWRFRRWLKHGVSEDADLTSLCATAAEAWPLRSCPRAVLVDAPISPMLWAIGRPTILFPSDLWRTLDSTGRRTLVFHELAHVARWDHWLRRLEVVATVMWWWHPALWIARRELRLAEEECCDAWVVARCSQDRRRYADAILATLDFLADARPVLPPAACGVGRISSFERRFVMILHGPQRSAARRARILAAATAVMMLCLIPVFGADPARGSATEVQLDAGTQKIRIVNPKGIRIDSADSIEIEQTPQPSEASTTSNRVHADLKVIADVPAPNTETFLAQVTPDGKSFVTVGFDHVVKEFAADGTASRTLAHPELSRPLTQLVIWHDGSRVAAGGFDGLIVVWDLTTGDVVSTVRQEGGIRSLSITDDDEWLVSGSWDSRARVFNATTLELVTQTDPQPLPVIADVSPDGRYIATVTGEWKNWRTDGDVIVWDRASGEQVAEFEGHRNEIKGVRFSPDGKRLLTFGSDATARLWHVESHRALVVYQHPAAVTAATFVPNSDAIATGDNSGNLRLWEAADSVVGPKPREASAPIAVVKSHAKLVYRVNCTPDGAMLLTNSPDRRLRLWQTGLAQPTGAWSLKALADGGEEPMLIPNDGIPTDAILDR